MHKLLDITDVCRMLGITSRTLRFYEQKGLVESSTTDFSSRRRYNEEQIAKIKRVLVLRSLGLSVRKIQELQQGDKDLMSAITERKAELIAFISTKLKELNNFDEMLSVIENGESIYCLEKDNADTVKIDHERMDIINICTEAFIIGNYEVCFEHFSRDLKEYLPKSAFYRICDDTVKPIGKFISRDKTEHDKNLNNTVYVYLKYEKLGLYIKYVFVQNSIHGIWMNYYEV